MSENKHLPYPPASEEMSDCCGSPPIGDTHKVDLDIVGMCSECRDHACFTTTEEDS